MVAKKIIIILFLVLFLPFICSRIPHVIIDSDQIGVGTSVNTNSTFGVIVGISSNTFNGNMSNDSDIGYVRANSECNTEFPGSHFCLEVEVMKTNNINGSGYLSGQYWAAKGGPGFTANANDCEGWTKVTDEIGLFWDFNENAGVGAGKLTVCSSTLKLLCCGEG